MENSMVKVFENGELYPCKPDIFDKTYEKVGGMTNAGKGKTDCSRLF